ncbi:MAG: RICIN domain-containing protein [Bacteroidaceae bacterium]|nr:RICIN domain-containing protein [Bacteroidaceae bacterium]
MNLRLFITSLFHCFFFTTLSAQQLFTPHAADRYLPFSTRDVGIRHEGIKWGLDTAWDNEQNVRRSIAFMGKENVEVVRVSFQPTHALVNDETLTDEQLKAVNSRIRHAKLAGTPELIINSDHPSVDEYYTKNGQANADHWARLIMATTRLYQKAGLKVVTISPFNEPDYTKTGQGTMENMREICRVLRTEYADELADIRLSGGNTLNNDKASEWYSYLKPYINEGNTHQLAGSFDSYANFFTQVRADGNHASADEMHNVGDALVALEYGLQSGVWWGFDGRARGQMCRATHGDRLAYAENRDAWTAAAVYRNLQDNVIECFVGGSERQSKNSSYMFVCTDREVYYDGYGPTHEFYIDYPGGTGYQTGQTNAERVLDLSWGDDVWPDTIDGTYRLMNRGSRRVMSLDVSSVSAVGAGTNVVLKSATTAAYNNWTVRPVSNRVGGDFGYFYIHSAVNDYSLNVWNWSLASGGDIRLYNGGGDSNEQWYLKYAGDGCFYIVSRFSNLYLTAESSSNAANISQAPLATTQARRNLQMWRIIPVDARCEVTPPEVPTGLKASADAASILLEWDACADADFEGYTVLRAEEGTDDWNTIARRVKTNNYRDNRCRQGVAYKYKVKAMDYSRNHSAASDSVVATTNGERTLTAWWPLDGTLCDATVNAMDARINTEDRFTTLSTFIKQGTSSLSTTDAATFLQLPADIVSTDELTICMWMRWMGPSAGTGQRLFDFGSSPTNCMYLTPNNGTNMRLMFIAGGKEQYVDAPRIASSTWRHIAVTIASGRVCIYMNGALVAESTEITLRPTEIATVMNYIGRSQDGTVPFLKGYIDDIRIYNYALPAAAVGSIASQLNEDVNLDGAVDTQDVLAIYSKMLNWTDVAADSDLQFVEDVNHDGQIDTQDVLQVYEKMQGN